MPEGMVLGIDLGTSRLKAAVYTAGGRPVERTEAAAGTVIRGLHAEQDPETIRRTVADWIDAFSRRYPVKAVGFSAALHSFLVVDGNGRPRTRVWTWMDRRAAAWARGVRQGPGADHLHQLTGVPVHGMSPLVKWGWWRARHPHAPPDWRPVALKDYLLHSLGAPWSTDFSTAAGSGFLNVNGSWEPEALAMAGLDGSQLPVPTRGDILLAGSAPSLAPGGSDAAMAHLALAAGTGSGTAVLSLGTSGAVRLAVSAVPRPLPPDLFCYTLGPGRGFLVGAAFSNAGNLLAWLADWFGLTPEEAVASGLAALERRGDLPLVLPYLYGERSPWWREDLTAGLLGLKPGHGRDQVLAGALLTLGAVYRRGLQAVEQAAGPARRIRAASGLLHLPGMAAMLAGALGRPLELASDEDASLEGAALTAAAALQWPPWARDSRTSRIDPLNSALAERAGEAARRLEKAVPACDPLPPGP